MSQVDNSAAAIEQRVVRPTPRGFVLIEVKGEQFGLLRISDIVSVMSDGSDWTNVHMRGTLGELVIKRPAAEVVALIAAAERAP